MVLGCIILSGCSSDFTTNTAVSEHGVKQKNYVNAEGTVTSTERKVISSNNTREVVLNVKVGQVVSKGDVLVTFAGGETVVCPYDKAVITEVCAVSGEVVQGGKKILAISNTDTKVIDAEILERDIKYIEEGREVKIRSNADSSKTYEGKVLNIGNCAVKNENGYNVVKVEIAMDNEDLKDEFLQEGYTVSLRSDKK